jgi:hypothetical protein
MAEIGQGHNSLRNQNIYRSNPETEYTKLANSFLQDSRLSYEARGLLAELLSRPDDWEVTVVAIVKSGPAGRDKVYRIMRELESHGYATTRKERREDGAFRKHEYVVTDDPDLLIGRAAAELYALENPLPENPEVVVPFPRKPEVVEIQEVDYQQATSGKPVSGQPLPENPDTAKPLTANPHHTNKRDIQRKDITNPNARVREGAGTGRKFASAIAAGLAATTPVAAGPPPEPPGHIHDLPAVCWQTPKAQMDAATNPHEARAQRQVWITPTGSVCVDSDFKSELESSFPLVDLGCGLATAATNVNPQRGAIAALQTVRREFGYMQQREQSKIRKSPALEGHAPQAGAKSFSEQNRERQREVMALLESE